MAASFSENQGEFGQQQGRQGQSGGFQPFKNQGGGQKARQNNFRLPVFPPISGSAEINVGAVERIASVVGGAALGYFGLRRFNLNHLLMAGVGGYLVYRGATGHCYIYNLLGLNTAHAKPHPVVIRKTLTVDAPRQMVYDYWRRLENLPNFMKHLDSVTALDERRSHWEAQIPGGMGTLSWDAEIVYDSPGEAIVWRSVPDAMVENAGEVRFRDAKNGQGTELQVLISYLPPQGDVGSVVAKALNPVFGRMVEADLERFADVLETGEIQATDVAAGETLSDQGPASKPGNKPGSGPGSAPNGGSGNTPAGPGNMG